MPKKMLKFVEFLTLAVTILLAAGAVSPAQDLDLVIKISDPERVSVEVRVINKNLSLAKDISFLQNIADVSGLGERVEDLRAFGKSGAPIDVNKLIAGEFEISGVPASLQYQVITGVPRRLTDAAHISWLTKDLGLLMLADLLPKFSQTASAKVAFELPAEWNVSSSENIVGKNEYNVSNIGNAVFLVGKDFRQRNLEVGQRTIRIALTGDWMFSDDEAAEMARTVLTEHLKLFKNIQTEKININLLPFPQLNAGPDRWRAETRGSTVTIISGRLPFKGQALQRLHEQLRHEIFHIWIPNSLALSGNYDWFYEGFAFYHALRTGVELNQIRFEDFLNTINQAYQMEQNLSDVIGLSLIEASQKRWSNSGNFIYAKGVAVAFLCDVALLKTSNGKRSLRTVFATVYQDHGLPNQIQDGNTAILRILRSFPELRLITENYVDGELRVEWESDLAAIGVELTGNQMKVRQKLTGRQKDLLDKLGYNQWRKLGQKTK